MKVVLYTGFLSLSILLISLVYIYSFNDLSHSQAGGLAFLMLPILALAGFLSLFSVIQWIVLFFDKRFETRLQYFSILPCLPMFLCFCLMLVFLILTVMK